MARMHCLNPWTDFGLNAMGVGLVNCCLYKGKPFRVPTRTPFDLRELWHSPWYADLRAHFRDQAFAGSGCAGCARLADESVYAPAVPDELNPAQAENYRKAVEASRRFDNEVDHLPVSYSVEFTTACNLRCIMCAQHTTRDFTKVADVSCDALMANVDDFALADRFRVSGGEPLVSREGVKFVHQMATHEKLADVQLHLITNGLMLDRVMKDLETVRRLRLNVSLDGLGDRYEYIRRGGSWERISGNMERVLDIRDRMGKDCWRIQASMVLMKTSVGGIVEFTKWCLDRDIIPVYQQLSYTRQTVDEDLVHNRSLLREFSDWEERLRTAEAMLTDKGLASQAEGLAAYRGKIMNAKDDVGLYSDMDADAWLETADAGSRRLAVWGTGSNYEFVWADWVRRNRDAFDLVGFLDNDGTKWGSVHHGLPVHAPDALSNGLKPDAIIVAMATRLREDVVNQLKKMGYRGFIL